MSELLPLRDRNASWGWEESESNCDCDCDCACRARGSTEPLAVPTIYYLELTASCNNRCPGCGNVYGHQRLDQGPPLGAMEWAAIVERIAPYATSLRLTGGEPTLHPDFPAIVHSIEERSLDFVVFTNGRWSDRAHLFRLLRVCEHFKGFLISLHGAEPAVHERFSGVPGSFTETVANIRQAIHTGLPVSASTVITRWNAEQVGEVVNFALGLGVRKIVFNRYIGPERPGLSPTRAQLRAAVAQIEALHRAGLPVHFGSCIPQCFLPSSSVGCAAGIAFCTVDPWGNVRPCNHAPLLAGNLLEESMIQIWQSPETIQWREMVPSQCLGCSQYTSCHGGCRAMAMIMHRDADPLIRFPMREKSELLSAEVFSQA